MARMKLPVAAVLALSLTIPAAFAASSKHAAKSPIAAKTSSHPAASSAKAAKSTKPASATAKKSSSSRSKATKAAIAPKGSKLRGQQAIDSARVTAIQQALIREHYLTGEATGSWDAQTLTAMQKLQADQGWQTKLMPDSRALKLLGLGPDYSTAINAQGASFTPPPPASTIPNDINAGFADASGVNHDRVRK